MNQTFHENANMISVPAGLRIHYTSFTPIVQTPWGKPWTILEPSYWFIDAIHVKQYGLIYLIFRQSFLLADELGTIKLSCSGKYSSTLVHSALV